MLTREQITEKARRISLLIGRHNYKIVADTILPRGPRPSPDFDDDAIYELPEWKEYRRQGEQTSDWTRLVVDMVVSRQMQAAVVALEAKLTHEVAS